MRQLNWSIARGSAASADMGLLGVFFFFFLNKPLKIWRLLAVSSDFDYRVMFIIHGKNEHL